MDAIRKTRHVAELGPNLADYATARGDFSFDAARAQLKGLPGGRGLNIAFEAVDRHVASSRNQVAIRWLGRNGVRLDLTFGEVSELSSRFANVLAGLGIDKGDLVCSLLGRVPALYVAALGTLKHRAIFSPLFSAFGPEPIMTRLNLGGARVLVTTRRLYARKVAPIRAQLPSLQYVLIVDEPGPDPIAGTLDYAALMQRAAPTYEIGETSPGDPALLHFTSGTTGTPKGALHAHQAVVMHHVTGQYALDLRPGDVLWCTADPGWVTGTSYGIIAPLTNRVTLVVDEAEFDVERWYEILERERVTVFYTAPSAIRRLMCAGREPARARDLSSLRFLASAGEPLEAEAVAWSQEVFGRPFHDNWCQTETGGIMIANFAATDVKPGSMGLPMPGVEAAVVRRGAGGAIEMVHEGAGELALRCGWPSMFRAYLNEPVRYRECFAGDWYLTSDLVRRDEDGYFWFIGRADDPLDAAVGA